MGKLIQQSVMPYNVTVPVKRPRLVLIDIMQGMAMLLVVFGHHLLGFMPDGYGKFHNWLYIFHMPLFISISGFLIAYSYKGEQYGAYICRRFRKFFIPYVIIGIIITLLASLKYGAASIGNNLLNLLVSPKQSEATFLWYIYLLFFLYALYPLINFLQRKNLVLCNAGLVIIGILAFIFPVKEQLFCLDYFSRYFIFYAIGIVAVSCIDLIKRHYRISMTAGIISLVCFITISMFIFNGGGNHSRYSWLLSFLVIPAMYAISCGIKYFPRIRNTLVSVSKNCFYIYLLHMFFVQGLAFMFTKIYRDGLSPAGAAVYIIISSIISITGSIYCFRLYKLIRNR